MMTNLKQIQQQKQWLSPQQILTSKLLQMNRQAIEQRIYQELENNVLLDFAESEEEVQTEVQNVDNVELDLDNTDDNEFYTPSQVRETPDEINFPTPEELTQVDLLINQAIEYGFSDVDMEIATQIIYNLDERGYLTIHLGVIAGNLETSESEVLRVLQIIQSFVPSGIAARDLKECLMIQARKNHDIALVEFLENHFDDFGKRKFQPMIDAGIEEKKIKEFSEKITQFNPHPGDGSLHVKMNQVIPDLTLDVLSNGFRILSRSMWRRKIDVSPTYVTMLKNSETLDKKTKQFLQDKFQKASDFLLSLEERRSTIERVADAIFQKQHQFIRTAGKEIVPLKMKEIADMVQVDLSTVSRAVNGKFIQTPFGTFELRSFFGVHKVNEKSEHTDVKVKQKIQDIIQNEDAKSPFTDEKIVNILLSMGIKIARRTVSKYRETLGILPARLRRGF